MGEEYLYQGKKVKVLAKFDGIWMHDEGGRVVQGYPGHYSPLSQKKNSPRSDGLPAVEAEPETTKFNLNLATKEEIAKNVQGLRKLSAARVVERKPSIGYASWADLGEICKDLSVDWEAVEASNPQVVFS